MSTAPLSFEAWELHETPSPKPGAASPKPGAPAGPRPCTFSARQAIEQAVKSPKVSSEGLYRIYDPKGRLLSRGETLDLRRRLLSHLRAAERLCGGGAGRSTGLTVEVCLTPGAKKPQLRSWEQAIPKGIGDIREVEAALEAAEYLYELAQELATLR